MGKPLVERFDARDGSVDWRSQAINLIEGDAQRRAPRYIAVQIVRAAILTSSGRSPRRVDEGLVRSRQILVAEGMRDSPDDVTESR